MRFTVLFLLLLMELARSTSGETVVLRGAAQGTTYHIKFVASDAGVDAKRLQADVDRLLADVDRQMSTYRDDSEISLFNHAPAGEWFEVSPGVASVVSAAREISEKTSGAMDVTVGPLVQLWHFGPGAGKAKKQGLPTDEQIQITRERIGYNKLSFRAEPPALKKAVDGLEVDLSAIASGYTIDKIGELIAKRGITNFMVDLGGEVRAAGVREDGSPWRVAVERPTAAGREMLMAVPLVNAALATAGGTHKFFEYEGRRYSHVIDPSTGRPVEHALASVSVAAATCLEADGWDTPLLVLGPERGVACAEQNGIAAMFISHVEGNEVREGGDIVRTTSAWRKRFDTELDNGKNSRKGAKAQRDQ